MADTLADKFVALKPAKAKSSDDAEDAEAFEEACESFHAAKDKKGRAAAMRALLSLNRGDE